MLTDPPLLTLKKDPDKNVILVPVLIVTLEEVKTIVVPDAAVRELPEFIVIEFPFPTTKEPVAVPDVTETPPKEIAPPLV